MLGKEENIAQERKERRRLERGMDESEDHSEKEMEVHQFVKLGKR